MKYLLWIVAFLFVDSAWAESYKNFLGMEFVKVPAGTRYIGCLKGDEGCDKDEYPGHQVTLSRAFWIGKTEVTQAQWKAVMGRNPSRFTGDDNRPVEKVDWASANAFAEALSQDEGCGNCYRLPTEAEWEYMARMDGSTLRNAVYGGNDSGVTGTKPVCSPSPGKLGLCDVLGNVWEWTADWYDENYYRNSPATDSKGPSTGQVRVVRGGSWSGAAQYVRPSDRDVNTPDARYDNLGFRLLRTTP